MQPSTGPYLLYIVYTVVAVSVPIVINFNSPPIVKIPRAKTWRQNQKLDWLEVRLFNGRNKLQCIETKLKRCESLWDKYD